jgi:hypothetical protein
MLLFMLSIVAQMTGVCHRAQPVVEMESHELFAQSVLEP